MLLSIGMMVKNESKYLRECLESLQLIRDAVESELIIVDTGSTDNTVEIAKEFTDKVYFHEWNKNFSEIRNITVNYSSGQWFFCIDGDEVVENPEGIINFFITDKYKEYNTACLSVKSFTSMENKKSYTLNLAPRLFKRDKEFHFEGAVHNQPIFKHPLGAIDSELIHYGYIKDDKELMNKKFNRTSEILKNELKKTPENIYYLYQLSASYSLHDNYNEALEPIIKAYKIIKRDKLDEETNKYVFIHLAYIYAVNQKYNEAEKICLEALTEDSIYIDLYYYLAGAQMYLYKNERAIKNYEIYLNKVKKFGKDEMCHSISVIHHTLGRYEDAYRHLSILYYRIEDYEKAVKYINLIEDENILIASLNDIIAIFINAKNVCWLKEFYDNKILNKYKDLEEKFLTFLESQVCKLSNKKKEEIYMTFSKSSSDYAILNKLRLAQKKDEVDDYLIEKILLLDFNKLPLFYGDVIYFMMIKKYSLEKLFGSINDSKLEAFLQYLNGIHTDFGETIYKYLDINKNIGYSLNQICHKKILEEYALRSNNLKEEHYKNIFFEYLKDGFEYINKIYSSDVIKNEEIRRLKSDEDCFLLILYIAEKCKDDRLKYIKSLRKALEKCNYMKNGIELLMNETKADLIDKDNEMELYKKKVKEAIEELVNSNKLEKACALIEQYEQIIKNDAEIFSIKAIISIMQNRFDEAENILKDGLYISPNNFDLIYNLGYLYERKGDFSEAVRYYKNAEDNCKDEKLKAEIYSIIEKISSEHDIKPIKEKKKAAFFVKQGMDSFLEDIINGLNDDYETKKIIVSDYKQIDEGMSWADICWFEWCDELVAYGSKHILAKEKKIVCRLHRYEALTDYPQKVNWNNVDKLIIVTDHLKKFIVPQIPNIENLVDIVTINNGVNLDKYRFNERKPGFNIAYVGYIHQRKNPVLLLQIINKLVEIDKRYKLYIAGQFQDGLIKLYWNYQIEKMGLRNNVIFEGWQDNIEKWLDNKNYILSTSIHESFGYGIAEAMARGIKPVIHNFPFADEIWDKEFMFNSIDEAVDMIIKKNYSSDKYRKFIKDRYSLEKQMIKVKNLLIDLLAMTKSKENSTLEHMICTFNDFVPYTSEYMDKFDFAGSHIVIGKRELLVDNIELIEFILKNSKNAQLIITNILKADNRIILPDYILHSKNRDRISDLITIKLNIKTNLTNNLQGYIFDESMLKDINNNQLAYSWERGIPATQFMPALGWLRIVERYNFAKNFIKSTDVVLEAASGFGYGAAYFHDKCKQIYALDLAHENIEFAKCSYNFSNVSWTDGDVTNLPFENNKFDVYTSFETLEHLPQNLINKYFKEAKRVLKCNGIFIISTPNRDMRENVNNPFHIKEYTHNEFDNILQKYFSNIHYYSVDNYKVEDGVKSSALNMIAVCSNVGKKIESNNSSISYNNVDMMKAKFMINSDDIKNSEDLFNYLLDNNKDEEYMKYISEWFGRSKYNLTDRFNYYYSNMYRKFNSYSRFKYIDSHTYEEMELIGNNFYDKYFDVYFKNKLKGKNNKNILFILNALDINQSVMQFFINYLSKIDKSEYNYSILCLLSKNEFNNAEESINLFKSLNINLFVPSSNEIEIKIKEYYQFISENDIDYCVYSTLYYAPLGVLVYPLLKRICKCIGMIQFQQPEPYFNKKLDFVYTYIKKDNCCKNIFDIISPINTDKVDKSLNIRDLFHIDLNKKIIVSMGRDIKYKNISFWKYVTKIVTEIDNVCFVIFGCTYDDFKEYVPEILIKQEEIFFAGFNLDASAYLKSCNFYLNSYPGGGYAVEEAYYAGLPIITFYENEQNGETYDAMIASYYATAYLYKNSDQIFPNVGNFDDLFVFTKKLIEDDNFKEDIQNNRIIDRKNLSFSHFVAEFEKYISNLKN